MQERGQMIPKGSPIQKSELLLFKVLCRQRVIDWKIEVSVHQNQKPINKVLVRRSHPQPPPLPTSHRQPLRPRSKTTSILLLGKAWFLLLHPRRSSPRPRLLHGPPTLPPQPPKLAARGPRLAARGPSIASIRQEESLVWLFRQVHNFCRNGSRAAASDVLCSNFVC